MKFTQITTLALAAMMAFTSCSKEEVMSPGEADLLPGEALLSFKIGGKTTTYASADQEQEVKALRVFMSYKDGENIDKVIEIPAPAVTPKGLNYTLAKGKYTVDTKATLYFVANAGASTSLKPTVADLDGAVESSSIYTIANDTLQLSATGMTATKKFEVTLKQGLVQASSDNSITGGKLTLQRLAARVFVESLDGKYDNIKGFTIKIDNLSNGAKLFDYTPDRTTTPRALDPYIVTGKVAGQYGKREAVGYVYPSPEADLEIIITPPSSYVGVASQTIKFKPASNKNYKITIDPGTGATNPKFEATITPWDTKDLETTKPFNPPAVVEGTPEKPADVNSSTSIQNGKLVLAPATSNTIDIDKVVNLGAGNTIGTNGLTATTTITGTPADPKEAVTVTSTDNKIDLKYPINYSSKDITGQTIEIAVSQDGKLLSTVEIPIIIKANPLPDGFTFKTQAGHEFMHMTTRGTIKADIDAFNYIVEKSPIEDKTKSFGELLMAFYMGGYRVTPPRLTNADGPLNPTVLIMGKLGATCPPGFKIPTETEYASITGNSTLARLNVGANDAWQGGNGTTTTKYGVFVDNASGIGGAFKHIRSVQFDGKQMTIFYANDQVTATDSGEAVQTFNGNNAMGVKSIFNEDWKVFYKPLNIGTSQLLTRCVKDKTANVIW